MEGKFPLLLVVLTLLPVFQEDKAISEPNVAKNLPFEHTSPNPLIKHSAKSFPEANRIITQDSARKTYLTPNRHLNPIRDPRATQTDDYQSWQAPHSRVNLAFPLSGENQTFDSTNHTEWRDEIHNTSQNLIIKSGGNLTLINTNLTLIGTQGLTNTSDYSLRGADPSEEVTFFYYRWHPGQTINVRISWWIQETNNAVDAGIYSAQDFPNSTVGAPDHPEVLPGFDLTALGLRTPQGSPEETIFHVPANKGNLFFIALFQQTDMPIWGNVAVTDVEVPSLIVEKGGTLIVGKGSRLMASDDFVAGGGSIYVKNGANTIFEDSLISNYARLHVEAHQTFIRNVTFQGNTKYTLLTINGTGLLIENCSFVSGLTGIRANLATNFRFQDNFIKDCTLGGISASLSSNGTISNNKIIHGNFGIWLGDSANLTVDRNAVNNCSHGLWFRQSTFGSLSDNLIQNTANDAITLRGANHTEVLHNTIAISEGDGLILREGSQYNVLVNNSISGANNAILVEESWFNTFASNRMFSISGIGFQLDRANNNLLLNNSFSGSGGDGIDLDGYDNSNNIVSGNVIRHCSGNGISVVGKNNTVSSNIIANSSLDGIYVLDSDSCNISNNFVSKSGMEGIWIENSEFNSFSHNFVNETQGWVGIHLLGSNHNVLLNNSALYNAEWAGILLESSNSNQLIENSAYENNGNGIVLLESDFNGVFNNTAFDNMYPGIRLEGSNENEIAGNRLFSNREHGLWLFQDNSRNKIHHNLAYGNNLDGISLLFSDSNFLSTNNLYNNYNGLMVESSANNTFTNNTVHRNDNGIYFIDSGSNQLINNIVFRNFRGIQLLRSEDNIIFGNAIDVNYQGILLRHSDFNTLSYNYIKNSSLYGIQISLSTSNILWFNVLALNDEANAYDSSNRNQWDNGALGNYWDDYLGEDENPRDGIGDNPYAIPGEGGTQDHFPLMDLPGSDPFPPFINHPADIIYEENTRGNTINWQASDANPDAFMLWRNGICIKNGTWPGGQLIFKIDSLLFGVHNFTVRINDTS
ncbi:MAG: right-handed parallel beta-helix repeat-containing protein, partial [Candidatus Hodarchaeota archaeon]